jgi:hypothetical protein
MRFLEAGAMIIAGFGIEKGSGMKVQDFAYNVAARVIDLLEETQHYRIPDDLRKQVLAKIQGEVGDLIKKS